MKKTKLIFGALACLTLIATSFSSCTVNKTEEKERIRTITVSGTGTVEVKPDLLSLTFTVKSRDWNVNNTITANANTTEKVINAIVEAGVSKSDIQTYDYKITQETDYVNGRDYPGRYNVINTLNVLIRNPSTAGNVIDAAVRNGTNALSGFEYSVRDTTSALREARTIAVQKAIDAANLLAGASGCKVEKVIDIKEDFTSSNMNAREAMTINSSTPIQEGTVSVTSTVTITYSLLN